MTSLVDKILAVHEALDDADIDHAFGGALALAWCTRRARGTIDIDVNIFTSAEATDDVLAALPNDVVCTDEQRSELQRDGQSRLWWGDTPVDVFLDTTDFHRDLAQRVRFEPFAGSTVPFLSCRDLAVFKAFFNRTKDWADLEEMHADDSLDIDAVTGVLVRYLGGDDERIARLQALRSGA